MNKRAGLYLQKGARVIEGVILHPILIFETASALLQQICPAIFSKGLRGAEIHRNAGISLFSAGRTKEFSIQRLRFTVLPSVFVGTSKRTTKMRL